MAINTRDKENRKLDVDPRRDDDASPMSSYTRCMPSSQVKIRISNFFGKIFDFLGFHAVCAQYRVKIGVFLFECHSIFNFFLFQNTKMLTILWRNYLLTLKLSYIYQYFTKILRFLCALFPRKLTRLG